MKSFILLLSFGLFCLPNQAMTDQEALKIYQDANLSYQKLDYQNSINLYEELLAGNMVSTEVYYNLGNSYFKSGNIPKAILNYERARKMQPDDDDINFNLKIASLRVVDKIESVPDIFYKRWLNSIAQLVSTDTWTVILIVLIWTIFGMGALYITGNAVSTKKITFVLLLAFVFITGLTGIVAARSHVMTSVDQQAIIMAPSVYIKSSPDEKGNDLFILHEGTKVDLLDELNEWKKVRIANGSVGWMPAGELEII